MNPEISADISAAFIAEAIKVVQHNQRKIHHCLNQLDDDQVNWRPFETQNSIANIILHLCGNLGQWIVCGVGNLPDSRDRPAEFSDRRSYTKSELLDRLDERLDQVQRMFLGARADELLAVRRIQASDQTALGATWHSVAHLEGHTHEIVYITRFLVRDRYRFFFVPKTKEQGAP
jgi:uncharacterized damage-inducible protein DinB